jgi:hypothetical protein
MNKTIAPLALVLSLTACEPTLFGSHEVTTVSPAADGIDRLDFSNEVDAVVVQGSPPRVEITINENLRDYLRVRSAGGRLEVGMQDGYDYQRLVLDVRVTVPSLSAIELSGASQAHLEGLERAPVPRFAATASGASHLSGGVVTDRLDLELSGASEADLSGSTRELSLEASGASHATLDRLPATLASVELSGASHAAVWVDSEVHGQASGASTLVVRGSASTNIETSGASSVSRR